MGWAAEAAQAVRFTAEKRKGTREWTLFTTKVIEEMAGELWQDFVRQVQADMREFAAGSPIQNEIRVTHESSNNLTVERFLQPLQKLEIVYVPKRGVKVRWNNQLTAEFTFQVDDRGDLWFIDPSGHFVTLEDLSRRACEPLVQFYLGVAI